jgi:VanZ family protein
MISRPELRWTIFWWACDWSILAAVVFGSLTPPSQFPQAISLFNDKALHFAAYFLMAFWFAGSLERKRYVWVAVGLLVLGALIEVLQYWMGLGRAADWRDFVADALGIFLALSFARAGLGNWMAWVERQFVRA